MSSSQRCAYHAVMGGQEVVTALDATDAQRFHWNAVKGPNVAAVLLAVMCLFLAYKVTLVCGVYWNDGKLENCLFAPSPIQGLPWILKVADFGVARIKEPGNTQRLTTTTSLSAPPVAAAIKAASA